MTARMLPCCSGFHLYKKQLDAMPNRNEAYARRGAHWTFDAERFVQAVRTLKQKGAATTFSASACAFILLPHQQLGSCTVLLVPCSELLTPDSRTCQLDNQVQNAGW